jgi:poly-gamma-glutamate synthesis protein (capsule biosynthesis protein)
MLSGGGCAAEPTARWVDGSGSTTPESTQQPEATLAFAGDVHFAGRTLALLDDPEAAFGPISRVLTAADVAVVNLETAVTTGGTPEPKQFHFRAPARAYQAVRAAGIDVVSLANNHALDYGRDGLADTLRHAAQADMPVVGAGPDADAAYSPWVTEVDGIRIALLGLSQISELSERWRAGDGVAGIAMGHDRSRAARAVRDAKRQADVVIVFLHWGQEGNECPTNRMRRLAGTLARAGATAVIGTHAHLLQGGGWLGNTYVAYGLGNFLWWRDDAFSNDTGVLRLTLRGRTLVDTDFVPARISGTGQPIPAKGAQARRIISKFVGLRACTGLSETR